MFSTSGLWNDPQCSKGMTRRSQQYAGWVEMNVVHRSGQQIRHCVIEITFFTFTRLLILAEQNALRTQSYE